MCVDGQGQCPPEAPVYDSVCCPGQTNQGAVCREISYVLLAVSGTLEEGFELRKNMDYRPNGDDGPGRVNATFLGKALVRGYKSFLDIKNPTWREYKDDEGVLKTVNPALYPTGCDEHANRYAIYAVDSRQAINALAGEPRFLSIAPDMGLADLTAADDLTYPDIKNLAKACSANMELSGIESPDSDCIAFLAVTSTWLKSTFIPNGVIRMDSDGIVTDCPESTGIWSTSVLNLNGDHPCCPEGCGSDPNGGQVGNVTSAADYSLCIDTAIRLQEAEYSIDGDVDQVGALQSSEVCFADNKTCFTCDTLARYGTSKTTVRFNKVLSACELEELQVAADVVDADGGPKFTLQGCSKAFPELPPKEFTPTYTNDCASSATSFLSSTKSIIVLILSVILIALVI